MQRFRHPLTGGDLYSLEDERHAMLARFSRALHLRALYASKDYLTAYARHTDLRVADDPHEAIGGIWEEVGRLQFDFLIGQGMRPDHRMLDIGCGTLRGGRHCIGYLEAGHYSGMDISPKALEAGRQLVIEEGLSAKRPRLLQTRDLRFSEFAGETFDFILAQSVFSHLPESHIEECFAHIGAVMHTSSVFYFTFKPSARPERLGVKEFAYPFNFFAGLAARHGYRLQDMAAHYPHPRGQQMAALGRARTSAVRARG